MTKAAGSVEETTATTRRGFLGKATATSVAVGLLATGASRDAFAGDTRPASLPTFPPTPGSAGNGEISRWSSQTLLNDGGTLRFAVSEGQYDAWVKELKSLSTRVSSRRSALLNLWIGEYEMTAKEAPRKALHHFRLAKTRTKHDDVLHGWAAYNECLALSFDSQYNEAAEAFAALLYGHKKTGAKPLHGFNWQVAGSWLRRLSSRATAFNRLGEMGIPRSTRSAARVVSPFAFAR